MDKSVSASKNESKSRDRLRVEERPPWERHRGCAQTVEPSDNKQDAAGKVVSMRIGFVLKRSVDAVLHDAGQKKMVEKAMTED